MKLLIALSAFLLGAGAMLGAVQLGIVDIESEGGGSVQNDGGFGGSGGSAVEATSAGERLEGVDKVDNSPVELAQCARAAEGVSEAKLNPDDADLLAAEAPRGVVVVRWPENTANVSFHRSERDAENAQREYEAFAEANRRSYDERLFRNGTVVTAFETSAREDERRAIAGCL